MAIDFTLSPDLIEVRDKVRKFMREVVAPAEQALSPDGDTSRADRSQLVRTIIELRKQAREEGLWCPHMPPEWGGMGLGPTAVAMVSAEAAKTSLGPFIINCYAPDEGNMHTLLHWATPEQKEKYLRPLCEGVARSCFAMTEPEVAGSDPTLIQTRAELKNGKWIVNGHKWFISGARGANFAILIARTEDNPEVPQAANSAFIVDLPAKGWEIVRDIETMAGSHNHCEIRIENLELEENALLGNRGDGHRLGQYRLGPARLAHCMRWIGQIERALEMMIDRATKRFAHGSLLSEKQGIQWMIADSAIELYQAKLMVLHAAYLIENGLPFRTETSMVKYHVARTLWEVIDRAIQVHGALGYSTDSPLASMLKQARWARFADGADEVHKMNVARHVIEAFKEEGSVGSALGGLPI